MSDHTVFISHTAPEANLAICLKDWIESTFAGHVIVFVSSDKRDLRAGDKWFSEIDAALNTAGVLLVVCSPFSITRPWIHFESGCAWIRRVPVIPICHSGLVKDALATPLSSFHALTLEEEAFANRLLSALAHHFGISKLPRISFSEMDAELRKTARGIHLPATAPSPVPHPALSEEEISILKALSDLGDPGVIVDRLAAHFKMNPTKMQYLLRRLEESEYLYKGLFIGAPAEYQLADRGRAYLVENNLL